MAARFTKYCPWQVRTVPCSLINFFICGASVSLTFTFWTNSSSIASKPKALTCLMPLNVSRGFVEIGIPGVPNRSDFIKSQTVKNYNKIIKKEKNNKKLAHCLLHSSLKHRNSSYH